MADPTSARAAYVAREAVAEGVEIARNLINEPPNVLYPETFAERASQLRKLNVDVEVLDEKAMEKLGMGALLAVGQGSARESRLVAMRYRGAKSKKAAPLAIVGKGVCFDTGGYRSSRRRYGGYERRHGGRGLRRRPRPRAGAAQGPGQRRRRRRPGREHARRLGLPSRRHPHLASGQTIEVINTDAEGRLVLADALWWTKENVKPKLIVDLATLTGAIIMALGSEHAGLFSTDDELAERLLAAGKATGEGLWRMPLGPAYDKLIDSKFADMKNTGGRHGGSITAAQFLKRFVGDTPWAHLDIAGTAMGSPTSEINTSWGSGWGVRLLDRWIAEQL